MYDPFIKPDLIQTVLNGAIWASLIGGFFTVSLLTACILRRKKYAKSVFRCMGIVGLGVGFLGGSLVEGFRVVNMTNEEILIANIHKKYNITDLDFARANHAVYPNPAPNQSNFRKVVVMIDGASPRKAFLSHNHVTYEPTIVDAITLVPMEDLARTPSEDPRPESFVRVDLR